VTDDYIAATGLGLATGHGPVFSDLSFSFPQGGLAVVAGESGTGRSALLLAIGGRRSGPPSPSLASPVWSTWRASSASATRSPNGP
jgi:ATPase subunit of ABC transporter with duplicated ATPase domains